MDIVPYRLIVQCWKCDTPLMLADTTKAFTKADEDGYHHVFCETCNETEGGRSEGTDQGQKRLRFTECPSGSDSPEGRVETQDDQ